MIVEQFWEHSHSRVERASKVDISHAQLKATNTKVLGRDGQAPSDGSYELT